MDRMVTSELIVILFLLIYSVFQEIMRFIERRSLVNRILARDLTELSSYEAEQKRVKIPNKIVREEGIPL